jgi:threonine synthase
MRIGLQGARLAAFRAALAAPLEHGVWRAKAVLPTVDRALTLDEGGTPLTLLAELSDRLGVRVLLKNETMNPTWSFKDRYAAVAVSMALELGYDRVVCASTGNFGQAVAAYCALARVRCLVLCPPTASELMRRVMRAHGAQVVTMPKEPRADLLGLLVRDGGWCPVTSGDPDPVANPFGMAGYKTIGHEIARQVDRLPHAVLVPVGSGDCLFGIWQGLEEVRLARGASGGPRMVACQTVAAAPLVHALDHGLDHIERLTEGDSSAVSIVEGRCGVYALRAVRDSAGTAVAVDDNEILDAQRITARHGLLLETASAATIAVALKLQRTGWLPPGGDVVCVATGTAVKWPATLGAVADTGASLERADMDALARVLENQTRRG